MIHKKQQNKRVQDDFSDILHVMLKLHITYPDWRAGQIIANAVREYDGRVNCDPFYIEDKALLHGLDSLLEDSKYHERI